MAALISSFWGRSRSMKVFANYNNHLYNKNKKRQQVEISRRNNMVKKKKKRKNMNRGRSSSNGDGNGNAIPYISSSQNNALVADDFVVVEILSRLPVKSLMKFKSVCKRWRSSIQHDPYFHQLHYNHSKIRCLGFYVVTEVHRRCYDNNKQQRKYFSYPPPMVGHREYFFSAAAKGGGGTAATLDTFTERNDYMSYSDILGPVKGLVCLVRTFGDPICIYNPSTREETVKLFEGDAVCIYNPSTREETQWIQTTVKRRKRGGIMLPITFVFGFDPVVKKHKVFCHRILDASLPMYACEVLTVGDNSWKRIEQDQVPPYTLDLGPHIHVNGVIYWMSKFFHRHEESDNGDPEVLVAFDLGTDKYKLIPIPDFIIDQPRESKKRGWIFDLLEVDDGRVALLHKRNRNTVSMWILLIDDDDHDRGNSWTEVSITLPFTLGDHTYFRFDNVPGTAYQVLVVVYNHDEVSPAYYYDWKKNAFTKIEVSGLTSLSSLDYSFCAPFAESLFPVSYDL